MRVRGPLSLKVIHHTLGEILKAEGGNDLSPMASGRTVALQGVYHADDKRFQGCQAL